MRAQLPMSEMMNPVNGQAARDRLLTIPAWNQLDDPLPDGQPDPAAETDCGEECVCMAVYAATGLPFDAGAIRQAMGLPNTNGVTTGVQLCNVLTRLRCPTIHSSGPSLEAIATIRAGFQFGRVAIALGKWESQHVLHWILCVGIKDAGVWANDPWGGRRRHITASEWMQSYAGETVHVNVK